jgi:hypothetical protein
MFFQKTTLSSLVMFALALSTSGSVIVERNNKNQVGAKCNPNYRNFGLSLVQSGYPWSTMVDKLPKGGHFLGEQTTRPGRPTYVALPLQDPTLGTAITLMDNDSFGPAPYDKSKIQPNQLFYVECDFCDTNPSFTKGVIASGCCVIAFTTGQCMQSEGGFSDPRKAATCSEAPTQKFDFIAGY